MRRRCCTHLQLDRVQQALGTVQQRVAVRGCASVAAAGRAQRGAHGLRLARSIEDGKALRMIGGVEDGRGGSQQVWATKGQR